MKFNLIEEVKSSLPASSNNVLISFVEEVIKSNTSIDYLFSVAVMKAGQLEIYILTSLWLYRGTEEKPVPAEIPQKRFPKT